MIDLVGLEALFAGNFWQDIARVSLRDDLMRLAKSYQREPDEDTREKMQQAAQKIKDRVMSDAQISAQEMQGVFGNLLDTLLGVKKVIAIESRREIAQPEAAQPSCLYQEILQASPESIVAMPDKLVAAFKQILFFGSGSQEFNQIAFLLMQQADTLLKKVELYFTQALPNSVQKQAVIDSAQAVKNAVMDSAKITEQEMQILWGNHFDRLLQILYGVMDLRVGKAQTLVSEGGLNQEGDVAASAAPTEGTLRGGSEFSAGHVLPPVLEETEEGEQEETEQVQAEQDVAWSKAADLPILPSSQEVAAADSEPTAAEACLLLAANNQQTDAASTETVAVLSADNPDRTDDLEPQPQLEEVKAGGSAAVREAVNPQVNAILATVRQQNWPQRYAITRSQNGMWSYALPVLLTDLSAGKQELFVAALAELVEVSREEMQTLVQAIEFDNTSAGMLAARQQTQANMAVHHTALGLATTPLEIKQIQAALNKIKNAPAGKVGEALQSLEKRHAGIGIEVELSDKQPGLLSCSIETDAAYTSRLQIMQVAEQTTQAQVSKAPLAAAAPSAAAAAKPKITGGGFFGRGNKKKTPPPSTAVAKNKH